ncbi:hypothetical protein Trydic_g1351 [Trypoxylus dichotomus]
MLDIDPCQTLDELSATLDVDRFTVRKCLHKAENSTGVKGTLIGVWSRAKCCFNNKKGVLHRIITGDKEWIHYDNPKCKLAWVKPGELVPSKPKRNNHGLKVMLCIWWDVRGIVYYELLKPSETINFQLYRHQLVCFKQTIQEKRPD